MAHKYDEKTLSTEKIYSGRMISLQVDQVKVPNGTTHAREIVKHPGAVGIIAITDQQKLILVDQFRKPLERGLLEIPAGKLEPGELPTVTAARELEEETSLAADDLKLLYSFYTSPGFADEIIHLFVATGISSVENAAVCDEDEFVDVIEVTLGEALQLVADGQIKDAKTLIAVQYMQLHYGNA